MPCLVCLYVRRTHPNDRRAVIQPRPRPRDDALEEAVGHQRRSFVIPKPKGEDHAGKVDHSGYSRDANCRAFSAERFISPERVASMTSCVFAKRLVRRFAERLDKNVSKGDGRGVSAGWVWGGRGVSERRRHARLTHPLP